MQNYPASDYLEAFWKVIHYDKSQINQGHQTYSKIDRKNAEYFELYQNGKIIFSEKINNCTLVHRMRVRRKLFNFSEAKKTRILALLKKNSDESKNISFTVINGNLKQTYSFDPNLSRIFYFYQNGKIQKKNAFENIEPFRPIFLRDEELANLNGDD